MMNHTIKFGDLVITEIFGKFFINAFRTQNLGVLAIGDDFSLILMVQKIIENCVAVKIRNLIINLNRK